MTAPQTDDLKSYIVAAAGLQTIALDADPLEAVTRQFALLAEMAERMHRAPLPPDCEPAPVYRP